MKHDEKVTYTYLKCFAQPKNTSTHLLIFNLEPETLSLSTDLLTEVTCSLFAYVTIMMHFYNIQIHFCSTGVRNYRPLWNKLKICTIVFPTFCNCFANIKFDSSIFLVTCRYGFLKQSPCFLQCIRHFTPSLPTFYFNYCCSHKHFAAVNWQLLSHGLCSLGLSNGLAQDAFGCFRETPWTRGCSNLTHPAGELRLEKAFTSGGDDLVDTFHMAPQKVPEEFSPTY